MDLMNDRERTGATGPPPAHLLRPAPLGREDFAAGVRTALRDLHRLAAVAGRTPGLTVVRGVGVAGFVARRGELPGVPHVDGVRLSGGTTVPADLVVDCTGRRSRLPEWLAAAGARRPVDEREATGFVYYGRHFRAPPTGSPPS